MNQLAQTSIQPDPILIRECAQKLLATDPNLKPEELRAELEKRFIPGSGKLGVVGLPLPDGATGLTISAPTHSPFSSYFLAIAVFRWLFTRKKDHGHKVAECIAGVILEFYAPNIIR